MSEHHRDDPLYPVIQAVQGFYARKDQAHDLEHALRVRAWGQRLAREEGADSETVELAALLHDIGRAGTLEKSHAESSAGLSMNILSKLGYSQARSLAVREAVISHSRESGYEPQTIEAKVLYDADKLDFVGPVGIARLFVLAGVDGRPLVGPNSSEEFFNERIRGYDQHLYTKAGRSYFAPLFAYMEDFWQQLHRQLF